MARPREERQSRRARPQIIKVEPAYNRVKDAIAAGEHYDRAKECVSALMSIATNQAELPKDAPVRVAALSSALSAHLKLLGKVVPDARQRREEREDGQNSHEDALAALEQAGIFAANAVGAGFPVLRGSGSQDSH